MANANLTVKISHEQIKRAVEEALPELAELRAAAARVRTLADQVERRMMATAKPAEIRAALNGEDQR